MQNRELHISARAIPCAAKLPAQGWRGMCCTYNQHRQINLWRWRPAGTRQQHSVAATSALRINNRSPGAKPNRNGRRHAMAVEIAKRK